MTWSAPLAIWFALSLAAIVLLHGIRRSRQRLPTTTLFIWREVAGEQHTAFLQRIVHNVPLWLQLLLAALLVAALARPLIFREVTVGKDVVLVLDASASMTARTAEGTRFERARARARDLIDELDSRQEMAIVAMESAPRLVVPFTGDVDRLRQAVAGLTPTEAPGDIRETLRYALSVADRLERRQVILIGDGAYPDGPRGAAELLNETATFLPVRGGGRNVALTRLAYRAHRPPREGGQLFAALATTPGAGGEMPLTVEVEGQPLLRRTVRVADGGSATVVVPVPAGMAGVAGVRLDIDDDLPADNTARAVIPRLRPRRVLLAGEASAPLRAALRALPRIELLSAGNGTPPPTAAAVARADLAVFHRTAPPELKAGAAVVFAPPAGTAGVRPGPRVESPRVVGWKAEHPLLRDLSVRRLADGPVRVLEPGPAAEVLVRSREGALVAVHEEAGARIVTVAMGLDHAAFAHGENLPLLMANLLQWAGPAGEGRAVQAGEPIRWRRPPGTAVEVAGPDGRTWRYPAGWAPIGFRHTGRTGLYTFRAGEREERVAVNLAHPEESRIAFNDAYVGQSTAEAGTRGVTRVSMEAWPWLVLLGAGFLLAEWWIWSRHG